MNLKRKKQSRNNYVRIKTMTKDRKKREELEWQE